MSERDERSQPVDREAVLSAIGPQIDQLIVHGFHLNSVINMAAGDIDFVGPEQVEAAFRAALMQRLVIPENVDDPSNLILVLPHITASMQARLMGVDDVLYWEEFQQAGEIVRNVVQDSSLPQGPYLLELVSGNPKQNPKAFIREGLSDERGFRRLGTAAPIADLAYLQSSMEMQGFRGLNVFELLAYVRKHGDGIEEGTGKTGESVSGGIHGIKNILFHNSEIPQLGGMYFPSIVRSQGNLRCYTAGLHYTPKTMREVPYTRAQTRFLPAAKS